MKVGTYSMLANFRFVRQSQRMKNRIWRNKHMANKYKVIDEKHGIEQCTV